MTNDVWAWLVNSRVCAYTANKQFDGPSSFDAGPCWCFDRFGQSETQLPDGRILFVGGEHEDYYDPDFYIYNDVVVVTESGDISVFAYPTDVFPPTDFHSATLVDNYLVIIGNLGYPQNRISGKTQVLKLELDTMRIAVVDTCGIAPGWIHKHQAHLSSSGTEIQITGGTIDRCDGTGEIENIDDWSLDIRTWQWSRTLHRQWTRFEVFREDKARNHLWEIRQLHWSRTVGWPDVQEQEEALTKVLGALPDLDLLTTLYAPNIADEVIGKDTERYETYLARVGDVIIRYMEDAFAIHVTIEGEIQQSVIDHLTSDLTQKFGALELVPMTCRITPP